jgi:hypothetical protein
MKTCSMFEVQWPRLVRKPEFFDTNLDVDLNFSFLHLQRSSHYRSTQSKIEKNMTCIHYAKNEILGILKNGLI